MNAREGMRRVGLVLGLLGAIAGAVIGYSGVQIAWRSQRQFQRLQTLPVMQDVTAAIKAYRDAQIIAPGLVPGAKVPPPAFDMSSAVPIGTEPPTGHEDLGLPGFVPMISQEGSTGVITTSRMRDAMKAGWKPGIWVRMPDGVAKIIPAPPPGFVPEGAVGVVTKIMPAPPLGDVIITPDWVPVYSPRKADASDKIADPAAELIVDVKNQDGILTADTDKAGAISSIQLATGEWVHREPHTFKARLALVFPFCYPVVGFLVPWGTIKVLLWVGTGFIEARSSP